MYSHRSGESEQPNQVGEYIFIGAYRQQFVIGVVTVHAPDEAFTIHRFSPWWDAGWHSGDDFIGCWFGPL